MPCYLSSDLGVVEELRLALNIPDEARVEFITAVRNVPQVVKWGKVLEKVIQRQEQQEGDTVYQPHLKIGFNVPSGHERDMEGVLVNLKKEIDLFVDHWHSQYE